ncbi:MAG: hypothetical protein ACTSSP_09360, partial [Candidatus Asgardarchaeia archaeon]
MAFQRYIDGFDQCEPPVCPSDITINIINWSCNIDRSLYVEWTINDVYNRSFSHLGYNQLVWGCNDSSSFNNSVISFVDIDPYNAIVDISSCDGVVYFKVKIRIDQTFFESDTYSINVDMCGLTVNTYMVRAQACSIGDVPQGYSDLYIDKTGVPTIPLYFRHDNLCWYIDEDSYDNEVTYDDSLGIVLDSVGSIYNNCDSCELDSCPTEWEALSGDNIANFYIEYETYTIKDEIIIYSNFDEDTCTGDVVWSSTCAGTSLGEGEGEPLGNNTRRLAVGSVRAACFPVFESQLPIGIEIAPDCAGGSGTRWCVYIEGPDGFELEECGGDEGGCFDVPSNCTGRYFSRDVVEVASTPYNTIASETGTCFVLVRDAGTVQFNLPDSPPIGTWYTFMVNRNNQLRIEPFGSNTIRDNSGWTPGKYKWADAVGETLTIVYGVNNQWFTIAK